MRSRVGRLCGRVGVGLLVVVAAGCQTRFEANLAEHERLRPHAGFDPSLRIDASTTHLFLTPMNTEQVFHEVLNKGQAEFNWQVDESRSAFDPWYSRLVFETAVGAHVLIQAEPALVAERVPQNPTADPTSEQVAEIEPGSWVMVNTGLWPRQAREVVMCLQEATGGVPLECDVESRRLSLTAE